MRPYLTFFFRIAAAHIISYFVAGLLAFQFINYKELFESAPFSEFMKPMNSAAVASGPAWQIIRGFILSIALWPFKSIFLHNNYGWLKLWVLLMGLSILSTAAAAPGSIDGFIYTTIPVSKQMLGYFEVIPQTLLFSLIVYYWYQKPGKGWNIITSILVVLILMLSIMGAVMAKP
jgi:hypothetical protein